MQIKNQWIKSIACACFMMMIGAGQIGEYYKDYGPVGAFEDIEIEEIEMCTNEQTCNEIQKILDNYSLDAETELEPRKFDCSNVAELIWYVLEKEGYKCDLVGTGGIQNGTDRRSNHMFVWVRTEQGTVVVETTFKTDPHDVIGRVQTTRDHFYEKTWVFGSPTDCHRRIPSEVTGITTGTEITHTPLEKVVRLSFNDIQ